MPYIMIGTHERLLTGDISEFYASWDRWIEEENRKIDEEVKREEREWD